MASGLAAPGFDEIGRENCDGLEVIHGELTEMSTVGFEGIDEGWCRFDRWDPFVDVNEAVRWESWHIEIAGESAVPGDETILEVGDSVAVGVLDDGYGRVGGDAFPAERVVRRKTGQRTDVLYDSEAIEVLEPAQTHISCTDSITRSDCGYRLPVRILFGIVYIHSLTRTPRGQLLGEFCLWHLNLFPSTHRPEISLKQ